MGVAEITQEKAQRALNKLKEIRAHMSGRQKPGGNRLNNYTDEDFRKITDMWSEQVVSRMDEIAYADKKNKKETDPKTLRDRAIRSVDEEWGPEIHDSIKNYLGENYEGTINALTEPAYEKAKTGLNKLKETRDHMQKR